MADERQAGAARPRVVLVAPESEGSGRLVDALSRAGFDARLVLTPEAATIAAAHQRPAAIVLHGGFFREKPQYVEALRLTSPQTPILVLASGEDEDIRLRSLLLGAEDCLVLPLSPEEAVIRVRRVVERRNGLQRLALENQSARERAESMHAEVHELRSRLQRAQALLQTGIEFHQRLDPADGPDALLRRFVRNLALELHVDRLGFLGPIEGEPGFALRAAWGVDDAPRLPVVHPGGELAKTLAAAAAPALLERLAAVPAFREDAVRLSAAGFAAVVPVVSCGMLEGLVLIGEDCEGGAPGPELLQLAHYFAAGLAPILAAVDERPGRTCA